MEELLDELLVDFGIKKEPQKYGELNSDDVLWFRQEKVALDFVKVEGREDE